MKSIAILGTGPAGLMAAHACAISGRPFSLFSLPGQDGEVHPSPIGGAQFIHAAVPMLVDPDSPDFLVKYLKIGTGAGYAEKVYSSNPHVPFVSYDNVEDGEVQPAWNLRKLYDKMWESIAGNGTSVNVERITAEMLQGWVEDEIWDFIVSTIPRPALCLSHAGINPSPHGFLSQEVFLLNSDYADIELNTIVYNGYKEPSWYRASNLDGQQSVEWADPKCLPPWGRDQMVRVSKPIVHGCDCWQDNPDIHFAGRFGKWQKGILVHDGFTTAAQALMERGLL